ncbi:hypothetical protein P6F26_12260, partial [Roseibacterium sp. SDUM158017]|nr:hypothetical protein [Roseibacterium sp. SDUM158017]
MPSDLMHRSLRGARRAVATAIVLVAAQSALAQTPAQGDLTALRYYYEQDNEAAMRSEVRRLMTEFPDWMPPENIGALFAATGPERIDEVYRLIEAGDFDAARGLIAEIDAETPDWMPPAEMMEFLNLTQAQAEFDTAERGGDVATMVNIVRGVPSLLSCERVNNAWLLADAHLAVGNTTQAIAVFRAVTQSCTSPDLLIATLEKAAEIAPSETLAELSDIAQARAPEAVARIRQTEDRLRAGRQEAPRWMQGDSVIALDGTTAAPAAPPAAAPAASA